MAVHPSMHGRCRRHVAARDGTAWRRRRVGKEEVRPLRRGHRTQAVHRSEVWVCSPRWRPEIALMQASKFARERMAERSERSGGTAAVLHAGEVPELI